MIDERFSRDAFDTAASDVENALEPLVNDLEAEVLLACETAIADAMGAVVAALNALGHRVESQGRWKDPRHAAVSLEWSEGEERTRDLRLWTEINLHVSVGDARWPPADESA